MRGSSITKVPGSLGYPENLIGLPDSPSCLYVQGEVLPSDRLAVAIVGTRSPTPIGRVIAFELARDLALVGVTIVSGLAAGIDGEAHRGALSTGGRTIACLGAGPDVIYPKQHQDLYQLVPRSGALVSEYPPGTPPAPWRFPARNRIISGMSLGVVVVEAGEKSGALLTADWALKQGRPVMAVPGSPKFGASVGSNRLIQDGAYLVMSADDVLSFLGQEGECLPLARVPKDGPHGQLTLDEALILEEIEGKMLNGDEIAGLLPSIPPGKVVSLLSSLEMKGIVERISGGRYLATKKRWN
ncbi:MAG: DNA-processing protein DprA [Bacillota bacterium]